MPHPLCIHAAHMLQQHLQEQQDWEHNFGWNDAAGAVIGKMFGVLVVQSTSEGIGYLSAFSGKLGGANHHPLFVPPVFDSLEDGGFLNEGMAVLHHMNREIRILEAYGDEADLDQIQELKISRRNHSNALQQKLYEHYHFLNIRKETKSLLEIFAEASYKNPPAGAGECAAPKLLQYAFLHNMKPIAMAEFWWGLSPKSDFWKHKEYYAACEEKCRPILKHMLNGMAVDNPPQ